MLLDATMLARLATATLGLFLLLVGCLVALRGRERLSSGFLGAFLALVGLNYLLDVVTAVVWFSGGDIEPVRHGSLVASLVDPPLLLLFALVVARVRLTPGRVAAVLAPALLLLALYAYDPPEATRMAYWRFRLAHLAQLAPYYGLSFLLVLRRHLEDDDPRARERTGILVVVAGLIVLPRLPLLLIDVGAGYHLEQAYGETSFALGLAVALLVLYGAIVVAVRALVPTARRGGPHARTLASLGFLLVLVALAWSANGHPPLRVATFPLTYSFRWLLVAAVLGLTLRSGDLLDLPAREQRILSRSVVAVLVVAAVLEGAAIFATLGMDPRAAATASFGVGLAGLAGVLAFRRAFPTPADEMSWRRSNLYRAMLERGVPEEELAEARRRWGISPAEERELRALAAAEDALPRPSRPVPLAPGVTALGRYDVIRLLGAGSSGRAFLAWDRLRREEVVLKEPHGLGDAEEQRAWAAEAEALARVDDPHVARLRGLEHGAVGPILILDHVEGETLRARLGRGRLPARDLDRLARGLLAGVGALHRAGLLHRDVKPENLILRPDGAPVLVDLGLAGPGGGSTRRGPFGGTPGYASPEQLRGDPGGPASDLHAVARVLWEAGGVGEPTWHEALSRALHADPARRWRDAESFLQALPPLAARMPAE